MITDEEDSVRATVLPLEITWRNPPTLVWAHLRVKERSNPYYGWAEQARKSRARRVNWNASHYWAA
jgi:hypothetical protein